MNGKISKSLSVENAKELLNFVDAFLFDCDGVIWKGENLIDGVPETLDLLRSHGKKLVFVTNSSIKSRRQCAKKFHSLGIPVNEDEIFSSSFAAAMYLKVNDFPREKKVSYHVGSKSLSFPPPHPTPTPTLDVCYLGWEGNKLLGKCDLRMGNLCGMYGCCNMWNNPKRAYYSWEAIDLSDGLSIAEVRKLYAA
ncbi:hypothetical protein KY289_020026 [Solanum tuberosum]|nr:hypothetical protein KY289_020026 [Solanum tuberosum]